MISVTTQLRTVALSFGAALSVAAQTPAAPSPRPPAVPLIVNNPSLSIWSMADTLNGAPTLHWTRQPHTLTSLIRIDGRAFRLMGNTPASLAPLPQTDLAVLPTRSVYDFEGSGVHVTMTFLTPMLPTSLELVGRPASYITWSLRAVDGAKHRVELYDSLSADVVVNSTDEYVQWGRDTVGSLTALHVGTEDQFYLHTSGDNVRIDWGNAYLAAPSREARERIGPAAALEQDFADGKPLPAEDDRRMPRAAADEPVSLAMTFQLPQVAAAVVERHVIVAYDEVYSMAYLGERPRPYWRRNGAQPADLLRVAEHDYPSLVERSRDFDEHLVADLRQAGGEGYAQLGSLAYRQALGGAVLAADSNGQPMFFTKENTSNGDTSTVDVLFPLSPQLLLFSPALTKAALAPVLVYAASDRWKFPNAPHDLEKFPIAFGTDDGGEAMPVEESANLILIIDAIAHADHDLSFASRWWPQLTSWTAYLEKYGNDPGEQLCADDFMGLLAHNANLAVKAIVGLAAYGDLARMRGDTATADRFEALAHRYAAHWMQAADDGDHYRLAFDRPNTWSQKYNLIWDAVLGLHIFPDAVTAKEVAYYRTKLQPFGVPLDSRSTVSEVPWTLWIASLSGRKDDLTALLSPMERYLNQTTNRVPLSDVYDSTKIDSAWLDARPVVGAVFTPLLRDPAVWAKWSGGNKETATGWALAPPRPVPLATTDVVPTSQTAPQMWRYTLTAPASTWTGAGFDDGGWQSGAGLFGRKLPQARTQWTGDDIWMRKSFVLPAGVDPAQLRIKLFHNGNVDVYLNGERAAWEQMDHRQYDVKPIPLHIARSLRPGATVILAVHAKRITDDPGVDVGLVTVPRSAGTSW